MSGTDKKDKSEDSKSSAPPLQIVEDTVEDNDADEGDIATPRRDTDDDDDQPL
jgi:hypothetical protein